MEKTKDRDLVGGGVGVFICNRCARMANNFLTENLPPGTAQCSVCCEVAPREEYLIFEGLGALCPACVRAVLDATGAKVNQ